jgi:hypothetical protein
MSAVHNCKTGRIEVSYSAVASNSTTNGVVAFAIYIDGGVQIGLEKIYQAYTNSSAGTAMDSMIFYVPIGTVKVDIYYRATGATGTVTTRNFTIKDV